MEGKSSSALQQRKVRGSQQAEEKEATYDCFGKWNWGRKGEGRGFTVTGLGSGAAIKVLLIYMEPGFEL